VGYGGSHRGLPCKHLIDAGIKQGDPEPVTKTEEAAPAKNAAEAEELAADGQGGDPTPEPTPEKKPEPAHPPCPYCKSPFNEALGMYPCHAGTGSGPLPDGGYCSVGDPRALAEELQRRAAAPEPEPPTEDEPKTRDKILAVLTPHPDYPHNYLEMSKETIAKRAKVRLIEAAPIIDQFVAEGTFTRFVDEDNDYTTYVLTHDDPPEEPESRAEPANVDPATELVKDLMAKLQIPEDEAKESLAKAEAMLDAEAVKWGYIRDEDNEELIEEAERCYHRFKAHTVGQLNKNKIIEELMELGCGLGQAEEVTDGRTYSDYNEGLAKAITKAEEAGYLLTDEEAEKQAAEDAAEDSTASEPEPFTYRISQLIAASKPGSVKVRDKESGKLVPLLVGTSPNAVADEPEASADDDDEDDDDAEESAENLRRFAEFAKNHPLSIRI
ncbi:MAG: hypothetical protein WA532_11430, partial [Candidatus Korobacteraceae bacterium]